MTSSRGGNTFRRGLTEGGGRGERLRTRSRLFTLGSAQYEECEKKGQGGEPGRVIGQRKICKSERENREGSVKARGTAKKSRQGWEN